MNPSLVCYTGDCLDILNTYPNNHFDLIITSPPYETQRKYGELDFNLKGQKYLDWCVDRFKACLAKCKGPVFWVMGHGQGGKVKPYIPTPQLFMAQLHSEGIHLLSPLYYYRHGIPGSGGRQWFASKTEVIVAATNAPNGRLPYVNHLAAMGHPPKCAPGGSPSHRSKDDSRVFGNYRQPKLANPGDFFCDEVIDCGAVGGGNIGSEHAHANEAPFPETLVAPLIEAFCPPDGLICDPFCGSGTTCAVALQLGRKAVGIDVRQSQIDATRLRCGQP